MNISKPNFLAVNRAYDLTELVRGEVPKVKAYVVTKETVGKKTSIFPVTLFTHLSTDSKKLDIFRYSFVSNYGDTDNQQLLTSSFTFTEGFTDEEVNDLNLEFMQDENNEYYFEMTHEFFTTTLPSMNAEKIYKSINVSKIKDPSINDSGLFTIPRQDEDGGETVILYSEIRLEENQFEVLSKLEPTQKEDDTTKVPSVIGINLDIIVLSFNLDNAVIHLCEELSSNHLFEPISVTVCKQVVTEASHKLAFDYKSYISRNYNTTKVTEKQLEETQEGFVGDENEFTSSAV